MTDPVTMLAAGSTAASGIGSIFGAAGAASAAGAKSRMYQYQAGIANLNAQIAEQNSEYALNKGESEAQKYGLGARQRQGQIVAAQASSGIDVRSGSSKDVQESQHLVSQMDMDQIRTNAAKVAYDYRNQAQGYRNQAILDLMGSEDAESAGNINIASSLIGGATSVADKWLQGSKMGYW